MAPVLGTGTVGPGWVGIPGAAGSSALGPLQGKRKSRVGGSGRCCTEPVEGRVSLSGSGGEEERRRDLCASCVGKGWHSQAGPVFHPGRAEEGWGGCRPREAGRQAAPGLGRAGGARAGLRGAEGRTRRRAGSFLRCGLSVVWALGWGLGTRDSGLGARGSWLGARGSGLAGRLVCGGGGPGGPGGRLSERSRLLGLVGEGRPRLRPYHPERARSRLISEAKQGRAWLVLGWETAWEYRVL